MTRPNRGSKTARAPRPPSAQAQARKMSSPGLSDVALLSGPRAPRQVAAESLLAEHDPGIGLAAARVKSRAAAVATRRMQRKRPRRTRFLGKRTQEPSLALMCAFLFLFEIDHAYPARLLLEVLQVDEQRGGENQAAPVLVQRAVPKSTRKLSLSVNASASRPDHFFCTLATCAPRAGTGTSTAARTATTPPSPPDRPRLARRSASRRSKTAAGSPPPTRPRDRTPPAAERRTGTGGARS